MVGTFALTSFFQAMVASYIIWYIVVGNAAGVIVFLWIWMLIGYYALLKFPKFVVVGEFYIFTT